MAWYQTDPRQGPARTVDLILEMFGVAKTGVPIPISHRIWQGIFDLSEYFELPTNPPCRSHSFTSFQMADFPAMTQAYRERFYVIIQRANHMYWCSQKRQVADQRMERLPRLKGGECEHNI